MWSIPKIAMTALEDEAAGVELPRPTELAVSSSGPADRRQTLHTARLDKMMLKPPLPTFSATKAPEPMHGHV
jgi:hypothetical protein